MKKRPKKPRNESASFERALEESKDRQYLLRLYVTGATPRSVRAIDNITHLCEEHLKGRYRLEVVDVYRQPELVKGQDLVAVPTLIKLLPKPLRRFIGDMMTTERLLVGLDLRLAQVKDAAAGKDTGTHRHGDAEKKKDTGTPGPADNDPETRGNHEQA